MKLYILSQARITQFFLSANGLERSGAAKLTLHRKGLLYCGPKPQPHATRRRFKSIGKSRAVYARHQHPVCSPQYILVLPRLTGRIRLNVRIHRQTLSEFPAHHRAFFLFDGNETILIPIPCPGLLGDEKPAFEKNYESADYHCRRLRIAALFLQRSPAPSAVGYRFLCNTLYPHSVCRLSLPAGGRDMARQVIQRKHCRRSFQR